MGELTELSNCFHRCRACWLLEKCTASTRYYDNSSPISERLSLCFDWWGTCLQVGCWQRTQIQIVWEGTHSWNANRKVNINLNKRTLKIYRNSYLRGSYCSLQIKPDDEGNEPPLATYEDIKLNLNLKDECGDYALNFTHPVRLHYFAELKPSKNKKEILDVSQISTLKQNRSKQDCQVYPFRLFECDKLIKFEYSDQEITLQFSESGVYTFWLLLNEEFVLGAPLKLTIIKSEKEEELAKK